MGGSLILIPSLAICIGTKNAIPIAAILLCLNNMVKINLYFQWINVKKTLILMIPIGLGALIGSLLMIKMNDTVVSIWLFVFLVLSFWNTYHKNFSKLKLLFISFLAGLSSGFSGVSGPFKGLAIKNYFDDKFEVVAAASCISLVSDSVKSISFFFNTNVYQNFLFLIFPAIIIMPLASYLGKKFNEILKQATFDHLFYVIMLGYLIKICIKI